MDLERWLDAHGLGGYLAAFVDHEVSLGDLPHLTAEDLSEIGLPVGPRRRFLTAAAELHRGSDLAAAEIADDTADRAVRQAERRQMTVAFFDLVGSTELSTRFDPEDLREVMKQYHELVTDVIVRHGGHVAKYLGDGTLAYFGWPVASEDQAACSVRAALEVTVAVGTLDIDVLGGERLASRVGIATGPVVVGDLSGESDAIVGRTPNLAARLEGEARPGHVVIDQATAGMVDHDFELAAPESRSLKGIEQSVEVIEVIGGRTTTSRFEAVHRTQRLTPFVGRQAELGLLRQSWELAAAGDGQIVMVGGEAGIGKSRLVHEMQSSIGDTDHELFQFQCSPAHGASVLHPVLRQIEHRSGLRDQASDADRFARLTQYVEGWSGHSAAATATAVSVLAELLGVSLDAPQEDLTGRADAGRKRSDLMRLLAAQIQGAAERSPVIIVFEDLHWADPTTLELLRMVASGLHKHRIMLVGTHRPDWDTRSLTTDRVTTLSLNRLASGQVRELAVALAKEELNERVLEEIVQRTDGNPLYVEEFAASQAVGGRNDGSHVPETLSASLMAQLDRLGDAKWVAQVASVIGREFSRELLSGVLGRRPDALSDDLEGLIAAGVVIDTPSDHDDLEFRHALVRDAAYESLLFRDRREIHGRVADILSTSRAVVRAEPELVAQHCSAAQDWTQAAEFWRLAGSHAVAAGASAEAVSHLEAALGAIAKCGVSEERDRIELAVLLDLAPASMTVRGFASGTSKQYYDRAYELAAGIGDENQRFIALWGGYFVTEIQAQWKQSTLNIDRLLDLDVSQLRPDLPIQIDHAASTYAHSIGDVERGLFHNRRQIAAYDDEVHADHRHLFGAHDPCVCAYGQMALGLPDVGKPEQAIASADAGVQLANELQHPPTIAMALWFRASALHNLGDLDRARPALDETIDYCEEHHVVAIRRSTEFRRLAALDDRAEAFSALRARIDPMRERDRHGFLVPGFAALCAEAAIDVGEIEHALDTLDFAERVAEATGERLEIGYIYFQRGRALRAGGERDAERAIETFTRGLELCNSMKRRWRGLQNAVGLAETLQDLGETARAQFVVASALEPFQEGGSFQLLRRAQELNQELERSPNP